MVNRQLFSSQRSWNQVCRDYRLTTWKHTKGNRSLMVRTKCLTDGGRFFMSKVVVKSKVAAF